MQYKLEKVFEEAGNREERYISIIKEQEEKLKKQSQQYLETLREIKKEFLQFIASTNKSEKHVWKALKSDEPFKSPKAAQRLNSI
jgi:ABC-type tungstate transport system permease subunit